MHPVSLPTRTHVSRRRGPRAARLAACAVGLALLCLIAPFPLLRAAGAAGVGTVEADTYIDGNEPNKNFGAASDLQVKDNPPAVSFVRFSVSGAPQGATLRARLRLFVTEGSAGAAANVYVFHAPNSWAEDELTWNLQPALGDQLGASAPAPLSEGGWVEIDLGNAVSGDGLYSFAITSNTPDRVSFAAGNRTEAPELILALDAPPTPTPEPTGEPTATPEPTSTPPAGTTTPETTATPGATPADPTITPTPTTNT